MVDKPSACWLLITRLVHCRGCPADSHLRATAEVDVEVSYLSDEAPTGYAGHSRMPSASSAASWEGGRGAVEVSSGTGFVEASVSRMLAQRDRSESSMAEFTRLGVATAVLGMALQALVDSVRRQQAIGRAGLQQLQLDVHYLRPQVQRYAAGSVEGPTVMQLFDELMAAGAERCPQPLLLDPTVLDRILATAQKASQQPHVSLL